VPDNADWNPEQYDRFKRERSQPFYDLTALVQSGARRVVDLGCGTGELTAYLTRAVEATHARGIDSSPAMLAEAAPHAVDGVLSFELGDIATWTGPADVDLVFANASLQWVPDHIGVLNRWVDALSPHGQLAVQVPYNHDHPAHTIADDLRNETPYSSYGVPPDPVAHNVLPPDRYAALLYDLGFVEQHVRLQVYGHELPDADAVVEWVKGTTLTRFAKVLPADVYEHFLVEYRRRLVAALGDALLLSVQTHPVLGSEGLIAMRRS
jgi:trans-aconitate 2-methyltransferase